MKALEKIHFPSLSRSRLTNLQVNLGYKCNQSCLHCHVNAGPKRRELMSSETIEQVLRFSRQHDIQVLDITGGAPEMNPGFRYLVEQASGSGMEVIDRCNLTIMEEPGYADLPEFLASQRVSITASLPCYQQENVDNQRGKGVFDTSIRVLQGLNKLGYGQPESGLQLDLVYNPQGPSLPPDQLSLQEAYKQHLQTEFGIRFNRLLTIVNMPINRFGSSLISHGQFDDYLQLLINAHQDQNLERVMCRNTLSVDWQGQVFDCDFNQMLGLGLQGTAQSILHISDLSLDDLEQRPIEVRGHCYGCTAGNGSSCGGALTA